MRRGQRQTDGREGSTKVADWHVFKPVFIQEVPEDKADTVTLRKM